MVKMLKIVVAEELTTIKLVIRRHNFCSCRQFLIFLLLVLEFFNVFFNFLFFHFFFFFLLFEYQWKTLQRRNNGLKVNTVAVTRNTKTPTNTETRTKVRGCTILANCVYLNNMTHEGGTTSQNFF